MDTVELIIGRRLHRVRGELLTGNQNPAPDATLPLLLGLPGSAQAATGVCVTLLVDLDVHPDRHADLPTPSST